MIPLCLSRGAFGCNLRHEADPALNTTARVEELAIQVRNTTLESTPFTARDACSLACDSVLYTSPSLTPDQAQKIINAVSQDGFRFKLNNDIYKFGEALMAAHAQSQFYVSMFTLSN